MVQASVKQSPVSESCMVNRAFITGVTGQDGAHLAEYLLDLGWEVYGGFRRGSNSKVWRLNYLKITENIKLVEYQLNEPFNLIRLLQSVRPTHIFHLAAESFVADSFKYPSVAMEANIKGTLNLLEAFKIVCPEARLFSASSSEVFGNPEDGRLLMKIQYASIKPIWNFEINCTTIRKTVSREVWFELCIRNSF